MSLHFNKLRSSALPAFLFAAGLVFSAPVPSASALTASDIAPIYLSPGTEPAINVNIPPNPTNSNSFGYFFDITVGTKALNALGLAAQNNGSGSYDVTLWKYVNSGATVADYTQLATINFDSLCSGCTTTGNFNWLEVPLLYLEETAADPTKGYLIGAIGDFSTGGASVFVDGLGAFDTTANYEGGGYNFNAGAGYPIPFGPQSDIIGSGSGFYNSNISLFEVPGPLPVMGAAAAFGWSRRLRRRINTSA